MKARQKPTQYFTFWPYKITKYNFRSNRPSNISLVGQIKCYTTAAGTPFVYTEKDQKFAHKMFSFHREDRRKLITCKITHAQNHKLTHNEYRYNKPNKKKMEVFNY